MGPVRGARAWTGVRTRSHDRRREAPGREEEADDGDHCEIVEC